LSERGIALPRLMQRGALLVLALLAILVVASATRAADWPASAALAVALLVPLALPVRGLLRGDRRTSAWATLCVIPYFVYGLTETIANPAARYAAGAILFASLALFVLLIAYLRVTRPDAAAQSTSTL
jgi:uncharacterized membrane protein